MISYSCFVLPDVGVPVDRLASVRHVILVMSGKGGVGKSTVAVQLSVGLRNAGFKVTRSGLTLFQYCNDEVCGVNE